MLRCCKLSRLSVLDLDSGSDELTRMKSWQSWHSSWHPATVMNSVSSGNKIQIFHNFQFSRMTIFFLFRRWGWTPCPSPLSWPCRWSWCWRARSSASASLQDCCSRIWCSETSAASVGDPRPKHKKIRSTELQTNIFYKFTTDHINIEQSQAWKVSHVRTDNRIIVSLWWDETWDRYPGVRVQSEAWWQGDTHETSRSAKHGHSHWGVRGINLL